MIEARLLDRRQLVIVDPSKARFDILKAHSSSKTMCCPAERAKVLVDFGQGRCKSPSATPKLESDMISVDQWSKIEGEGEIESSCNWRWSSKSRIQVKGCNSRGDDNYDSGTGSASADIGSRLRSCFCPH